MSKKTVTRKQLRKWFTQLDQRTEDVVTLLLEPVINSFRDCNQEAMNEIDKFISDKNHEYFVHEKKDGVEVIKTKLVHKLSSVNDKVKPAPVREFVMQPGKTQENYKKEIDDFLNHEIEITL